MFSGISRQPRPPAMLLDPDDAAGGALHSLGPRGKEEGRAREGLQQASAWRAIDARSMERLRLEVANGPDAAGALSRTARKCREASQKIRGSYRGSISGCSWDWPAAVVGCGGPRLVRLGKLWGWAGLPNSGRRGASLSLAASRAVELRCVVVISQQTCAATGPSPWSFVFQRHLHSLMAAS
jgi:hypothetical protein